MRGSASATCSSTATAPGERSPSCSCISTSVGGRPCRRWYWAANSGSLKNALKSRSSAALSAGAVKTSLASLEATTGRPARTFSRR
jgi:hypothetical protein